MKILNEIGLSRLIKYFIFGLWNFVFKLLPYSPLRIIWMRLAGAQIDFRAIIDDIDFTNLDRLGLKGLKIGEYSYLGSGVLLDLADQIMIKDKVTVSARSVILTHHSVGFSNHPLIKHYPKTKAKVILNTGCVLGVGSIIFPGVSIGSQSLVAAQSVVRKSVPRETLVAGTPAVVKKVFNE
jgi:acetyltransferase-like isoleucine patch superfamily enzyme